MQTVKKMYFINRSDHKLLLNTGMYSRKCVFLKVKRLEDPHFRVPDYYLKNRHGDPEISKIIIRILLIEKSQSGSAMQK